LACLRRSYHSPGTLILSRVAQGALFPSTVGTNSKKHWGSMTVRVWAALVAWGRLVFGSLVLLPIAWHRGAFRNLSKHRAAIIAFALVELVGPFYLIA